MSYLYKTTANFIKKTRLNIRLNTVQYNVIEQLNNLVLMIELLYTTNEVNTKIIFRNIKNQYPMIRQI